MSGVLDIERVTATCVAPPRNADRLAARVDGAMRNRFPEACRRAAAPLLDGPDGEIWFIRKLAVDVSVPDLTLDSDELAGLLGSTAGTAIAETIAAGPAGDRVIRFPSRSAYLAALLADLAAGRAFDRWYHADAGGLAPLPATAAIREALARDPQVAEAGLLELAAGGRLDRVLNVLSPGDTRAALDICVDRGARVHAATPELIEALARAWAAANLPASGTLATPANALRLYLALRSESPTVAPTADVLLAVLTLGDLVRSAADPATAARSIARGDLTEIKRVAAASMPAALPLLSALEPAADVPGALEALVTALRSDPQAAPRPETTIETSLGGAFLLLAYAPWLLDEPDPVRRFIPLARALGDPPMALAAADPAMRLAVGADEDTALPSALPPDEETAWSIAADALLRAFASHLLGFGDSSAAFLYEQFLEGSSTVRVCDGHVEVELPRAPLDVILRMAGVHGLTYELPWAGEVELRLPDS